MTAGVESGAETTAPPVDPSRVPVYPVVRLEVRQCGEDQWEALANGEEVLAGGRDEVLRAALAQAAQVADERPCGAVRVRLEGFDFGESGIVTSAGALVADSAGPPAKSSRRFWVVVAAVVTVLAVAVSGLVWVVRSSSVGWSSSPTVSPTPSATPTQLPVLQPPGWSPVAAWSLPVGASSSTAQVATGEGLVFAPAAEGGVVAVDAVTGLQKWARSLGSVMSGSSLTGGPVMSTVDGSSVVVAWTVDRVAAWEPATGKEVGEWSLPSDVAGVMADRSGVVVLTQRRHADVVTTRGLVGRVLPADAAVVGALADASIAVVGNGSAWTVTSETVAGVGVSLKGPKGLVWAGPVGSTSQVVVVAYSSPTDGASVVLRGFSPVTWEPLWDSKPAPAAQGSAVTGGAPLRVSPDGEWGVFGSTIVNLENGALSALPADWSTTSITDDSVFGVTGQRVAVADRGGKVDVAAPVLSGSGSPAPPVAVTASGWALIVAQDGPSTALYAVPRAPIAQVKP